MFQQRRRPIGRSSTLAIFGSRRGRRGAELKVMSGVEHKHSGWFVDRAAAAFKRELDQPGDRERRGDGWGYGTRKLGPNDFSYALGAKGSTRKKLAAASGAILEYVGNVAVFAGTRAQRLRRLLMLILAITIHNFPEGMAVGGYGRRASKNSGRVEPCELRQIV